MNFNKKVAVVTGAGQGIGKAVATRLASDGATVVINYRKNSEVAIELVAELESKGFKASAFRADVSKGAECRALIEHVVDTFGVVDVLVSNAGIGISASWKISPRKISHACFQPMSPGSFSSLKPHPVISRPADALC
jgi:NAD(P)-dependent dehydrogenase (short-subunit alcohol dehydrogenase family)